LREVGIIWGAARPERIRFTAKETVRVGEYVVAETEDGPVLYMVDGFKSVSTLLLKAMDYITAEEARRASEVNPRDRMRIGVARAIGLIEELRKGRRIYPTVPPEPGDSVALADDGILSEVYCQKGERWAEVGCLLRRRNIRVSVDLNAIASKHLAILAATGKGKSNFLALLAKKVAERDGTMVIVDYHSEYGDLRIPRLREVVPKLNPWGLSAEELADVIGVREGAERQRAMLGKVLDEHVEKNKDKDFWKALKDGLNIIANNAKNVQEKYTARRLLEIIDRALRIWGPIFDQHASSLIDQIYPNRINVLDVSGFTEWQAQVLASKLLEDLLEDRKDAVKGSEARFGSPVIVAIEEAHVFVPSGRSTYCSEIIEKVAREGRKFGLSLILVSQRPSRLNADVISQMGSFAISGLTHPADQRFIMEVTDEVTDELGASLPSLNPGEMILVGNFVRAPVLIKADYVREKTVGRDIDAVSEWKRAAGERPPYTTEELIKL
jgi:DNA helicase HerA-like ATPase